MIRAAVIGYGNIGKFAAEAIRAEPDFELVGVVRRRPHEDLAPELRDVQVVKDITELDRVDVALLCIPTRSVPKMAEDLVALKINTVDSFDLHGDRLLHYHTEQGKRARKCGAVSVLAAGWDPGSDSLIRALMEILSPRGLTFTNFGPGMSMGHSVAVKALPGVKDAIAMTIPKGSGVHRRLVYLELLPQADLETVKNLIIADPYFKNDETYIYQVESVANLQDVGHGALLERHGTSGQTGNQSFKWEMRINNPALTAQVMVGAARASMKQVPGSYTLLEIPLVDYFFADSDELIRRLV